MKSFAALSLLPLASAHFLLNWPAARGFDDDKAVNFPCGGFDTVQTNRTPFPISGGPIQLSMHHTAAHVQVLLALGNDPGNNYNIVLRPTFNEQGLGDFCMGMVAVPEGVNVTEGTNATIQVVTNGDPSGGLYQCADITFTSTALSSSDYSSHCNNGTNVKATPMTGAAVNANETSESGSTASSSAGSASSSTSKAWAAQKTIAPLLVGAVGMAGALAAL